MSWTYRGVDRNGGELNDGHGLASLGKDQVDGAAQSEGECVEGWKRGGNCGACDQPGRLQCVGGWGVKSCETEILPGGEEEIYPAPISLTLAVRKSKCGLSQFDEWLMVGFSIQPLGTALAPEAK